MDPIFKNRFDLKKKIQHYAHKTILPSLNECSYCNVFKCGYCSKFSPKCGACKVRQCTNCSEFNKSKKVLLQCDNPQISSYVRNFRSDYFLASNQIKEFFKFNVPEGKDPLYIYDEKISKTWHCNQTVTKEKTFYDLKGKKHCLKVISYNCNLK